MATDPENRSDNALILPDGLPWPTQSADLAAFSALLARLGYPLPGQGDGQQPGLGEAAWRLAARDRAGLCARQRSGICSGSPPRRCPGHHGRSRPARPRRPPPAGLPADRPGSAGRRWQGRRRLSRPLTLFGRLASPEGWDPQAGRPSPCPRRPGALLEAGIPETSTTGRIEALVGQGRLSRDHGTNLAEAFRLFMRLAAQPVAGGRRTGAGGDLAPQSGICCGHALHQVKKFQQWLTLTFVLGNSDGMHWRRRWRQDVSEGEFARSLPPCWRRVGGAGLRTTSLIRRWRRSSPSGRCASGQPDRDGAMPCHPGPGSRQPQRRVRGDPRPAPSGSATGMALEPSCARCWSSSAP